MHVEKWALGLAFAVVIIVCSAVGLLVGYNNCYNQMAVEYTNRLAQNDRIWQGKMEDAKRDLNLYWEGQIETTKKNLNQYWGDQIEVAKRDLNQSWQRDVEQLTKQWQYTLTTEIANAHSAGFNEGLSQCDCRNRPCDCQSCPRGDQHDGGHDGNYGNRQ